MGETKAVPLWEAARRLGVQVEDIFDPIVSKRVPTVHRPNGRPLVDPADVKRVLLAERGTAPR